jgi:hypothetical protein
MPLRWPLSPAASVAAEIPGVRQFFGSSPLLPNHWAIAMGPSIAATLVVQVWQL